MGNVGYCFEGNICIFFQTYRLDEAEDIERNEGIRRIDISSSRCIKLAVFIEEVPHGNISIISALWSIVIP